MQHEEMKEKVNSLKANYDATVFREIVESIKREKINDD